ncbi:type VI secretion system protein TssA [Orbaceae bacterium ESL0721]|nr:type VI secretion system protein TssA [Orbaceae bacterium ESL0721]
MFSQLITHFFGQQDPSELIAKKIKDQWRDWLVPISPEKPTGEDLTYQDIFQEIKEEITKLSGIDYQLISSQSENILKQSSKDIRVVTYYCLARLQNDGAEGFADGLELLAGLLDTFGTTLYPSRQNIRKNALEWLTNARFIDNLTQLQPIPETCLIRIVTALNLIDLNCKKLFVIDENVQSAPDLSPLLHFFNQGVKQPAIKTVTEESKLDHDPKPEIKSEQQVQDIKISSQRDLLDQARKMADYLRKKPEGYLVAGRFLRVIRWDTVTELPPADHRGKTRLPAPRTEITRQISRLIIQQQWSELFERVEQAFMEGANHFWLDLQRAAITALQKIGEPYQSWADIYLTDMGLMLERLAGIEHLYFENGMPFADDETLNWITTTARIHNLAEGDSLAPIAVSADTDWNEIEKQALELAQTENLENAFLWLQNLPALRSPKQRYLMQFTQARVAEKVGKPDIALKLLNGLNDQQNTLTLLQWESDLIFDLKRSLLHLIKQKKQLKEGINPYFNEKVEQLQNELIQIDPARAVTLM